MWADEIGRSRLFSENDSRADMAGGDGQKGLLVPLEIVLLLLVLVNVLVPMLVLLPVHIHCQMFQKVESVLPAKI